MSVIRRIRAPVGPTIPPWKVRTNSIPLRGVTVKGKGERVRYALEQTPMLIRYLEDYFAAPFAYPKLAPALAALFQKK